jgi:hypothetical protein
MMPDFESFCTERVLISRCIKACASLLSFFLDALQRDL